MRNDNSVEAANMPVNESQVLERKSNKISYQKKAKDCSGNVFKLCTVIFFDLGIQPSCRLAKCRGAILDSSLQ